MTELLDDSCRHLASRNQPNTTSPPQPSLSCVDHHRPASKLSSQRHIVVDNCCTLHCRHQMIHGRHRQKMASRRLQRDVGDIHRYLRIYLGSCGSTWRHPSLPADLPGYLRIYLETSIATCGSTWIPADLPGDIHRYLRIYLDTCGSTWIHPSLPADLPGYLPIYLETSIATCRST